MTQGIFIYGSRPKTKKALKDQITAINDNGEDPYSVVIEATSLFGNEFDGSLAQAMSCGRPSCKEAMSPGRADTISHQHKGPFYLVGPDPRTSRKWYATLTFDPEANKWLIK